MRGLTRRLLFLALVLSAGAVPVHAQEVLTLEEAIRSALLANPTIRISRNEIAIAENNATAGNAGFLPTFSATAGYAGTLSDTRQEFRGEQGIQETSGAQSTRQTAGTTLNWTVLDGLGRRFATLDRLQAELAAQEALTEGTVEALVADVIIAYHDLVRQQQQLEVFEEAVAISEERLEIAEARLDLGSASELEVRQARVDLNTDRGAVLEQQAALTEAKASFDRLLARSIGTDFVVADTIVVDPSLEEEALTAALDRNPQLRQAEELRRAAALTGREVRAERFPQLNLSLGYGYANQTAETGLLLSNRALDFTYGFSLSYDLFDGFDRRRRLENARLREVNAELTTDAVRDRLEADLLALYTRYRNSLDLAQLELEVLEATRLNVEVALERFRLGIITSVELREVQEQLIRAQSRLLTALFQAKAAETELRRLSGTLPVDVD